MKILIVSATEKEILPLKEKFDIKMSTVCTLKYTAVKDFSVDFLVTGIGSVFTCYALLKKLTIKKYDLVINAGIAGSFKPNLNIGDVVYVQQDQFADLGIEDKNGFETIFDKGFMIQDEFPFQKAKLENNYQNTVNLYIDEKLREVSAITVNTTHGKKETVELFRNKFNADIETMEGAAFFYTCLQEGMRFMQIRSISNYVEERNIANWNIPLAIRNLNNTLIEILTNLKDKS